MTDRIGQLKKLGKVKVAFSRRRGDRKAIALVTNDLSRPARTVVADYLRRWSIELLIEDKKQHLRLGVYRVLRYRAVVRHLPLVDVAYAWLTHLGNQEPACTRPEGDQASAASPVDPAAEDRLAAQRLARGRPRCHESQS